MLKILNKPEIDHTDKNLYTHISNKDFVKMWNEYIALVKRYPEVSGSYLFAWSYTSGETQDLIIEGLTSTSRYMDLLLNSISIGYTLVNKSTVFLRILASKLQIQHDSPIDYTSLFNRLYYEDEKKLLRLVHDEESV